MNAPEPSESPMDATRMDRLVDGELPEGERRELLSGLDRQPDGWRRCALAFLEAQCWHKELADFVGRPAARPAAPPATTAESPPQTTPPPQRPNRNLAGRAATAVAMAASFFAALWLGWALQDQWQGDGVAVSMPDGLAGAGPVPDVVAPRPSPLAEPSQRPIALSGPWQMVTLSANGPDGRRTQTIDLPACERQHLESQWPESLPAALPCEVLESLERAGYRVRQHRELLPLEMPDGRRLVVPVDKVEVQYVGRPPL